MARAFAEVSATSSVQGARPARAPRGSVRSRLLSAAQELVGEGGYENASVAALAGRAGTATGALYRHWPSKDELFAELFRSVCDREIHAIDTALAELPERDVAERAEALIATFATRALRSPRLAWALLAEPVVPLLDAERLRYRRRFAHLLARILTEAIESGRLPQQDAELTAAAVVGGVGEALLGPLAPLSTSFSDAGRVVEQLCSFTRRAIGAA